MSCSKGLLQSFCTPASTKYRDYIGAPGIPLSVRQRLVNLYAVYAGLGGNGHGEIMYRELLELPIITENTSQ